MTIVNSGVVAWRMAASDESMYCSPQVISVNGITMLTRAMNRSFAYVDRSRGRGDRTMSSAVPRTSDPKNSRPAMSVIGGIVSTPILMNR